MFRLSSDEVRSASTCSKLAAAVHLTSRPANNHRRIHNGFRLEDRRSHVRAQSTAPVVPHADNGWPRSYNRYLTIASRVVRRSLKEEQRLAASRRGESDLRFAKWEVSDNGFENGSGTRADGGHRMASRATSRA